MNHHVQQTSRCRLDFRLVTMVSAIKESHSLSASCLVYKISIIYKFSKNNSISYIIVKIWFYKIFLCDSACLDCLTTDQSQKTIQRKREEFSLKETAICFLNDQQENINQLSDENGNQGVLKTFHLMQNSGKLENSIFICDQTSQVKNQKSQLNNVAYISHQYIL